MIKWLWVRVLFSAGMSGLACNTKGPYEANYKSLAGYVIRRKTCHTTQEEDDWLVDFSYDNMQPQIGDTLVINGIFYRNIAKVKGLNSVLARPGAAIRIEYNVISATNVGPQSCTNPDTSAFNLKEILILNQFEIR